jgi:hypothetical protein
VVTNDAAPTSMRRMKVRRCASIAAKIGSGSTERLEATAGRAAIAGSASVTRRVGALRMMHRFGRDVYVATFKSNFGANSLMRLKICFYLYVTCTNSSTCQILITSDLERMAR